MKTIRCAGCNTVVARIKMDCGNLLKKGMVCLCYQCESERQTKKATDSFGDILNGIKNVL